MSTKKNKGSFLVQASILAAAGIFVRMIGMLYRSPLTRIIGDEGNGYYSTAYNIYTMILLISSYSIPTAVSKMIAAKLALRQYKNAHRIFLCALTYVLIIGGIAALITFIFAPAFVSGNLNAVLALRILAPTIFFSGLLGVFRGYFQAHNTMVPTSVSQIIEQIFNAVVSIFAAWFFTRGYVSEAEVWMIPIHGAAGGAVGTGIGVIAGFFFLVFVYVYNRPILNNRILSDQHKRMDSYQKIFKSILMLVTPIIFCTFIYNISTSLNMGIYYNIMGGRGIPQKEASSYYGIFAGKYMVLIHVPVAIASAISTAMIPDISSSYATGDLKSTSGKLQQAVNFTMLISIPAAIGLGVLAGPVMQLLFPQPETIELASALLRTGCITVIFYALSTITNGVLQGIGKVNIPVCNAAVSLIIQAVVLVVLLQFDQTGLYALLIATIVYAFLMCILNGFFIKRYLKYKQQVVRTFLLPLAASVIMGVVSRLSYMGIHRIIKSNALSLLCSVSLAIVTYFILIIKLGIVTKEELERVPKGKLLLKAASKLKLIESGEEGR